MLGFFMFLLFACGVAMIVVSHTEHAERLRIGRFDTYVVGGLLAAPFPIRLVVMWYAGLTTWDMSGESPAQTTFIASILVTLLCAGGIVAYFKYVILKKGEVEAKEEVKYVVPAESGNAAMDVDDVAPDEDREAA
jgi:hypothetical protein